jgi:hypothetical protein
MIESVRLRRVGRRGLSFQRKDSFMLFAFEQGMVRHDWFSTTVPGLRAEDEDDDLDEIEEVDEPIEPLEQIDEFDEDDFDDDFDDDFEEDLDEEDELGGDSANDKDFED